VKNGHRLHAFLLSDMLLLAEEKSNLFKDTAYVLYRQPLPLNALLVRDTERPPPDDSVFEIIDLGSDVRLRPYPHADACVQTDLCIHACTHIHKHARTRTHTHTRIRVRTVLTARVCVCRTRR
jgi:hypothetical protein